MIRRKKIALFVVFGAAILAVSTAFAGTANISGSITDTSPCYYDYAGWFPYHSYTFTAPVSGEYTLKVTSYTWAREPWLYVVTSPFVDDNIEAYEIGSGYNKITVTLVAGKSYVAVIGPDQGADTEAECHTQQGDYTAILKWDGPDPTDDDTDVDIPVPGCDVLINIPATAVVGAFTDYSELYFAPDPGAALGGPVVMEPGKTVWVLGMDESGAYYRILLSCDYYWVRAETIGPNYDAVWGGKQLPKNIVK